MKRVWKTILCVVLVLVALVAIVVGIPGLGFGFNVFERGGWSVADDGQLRYLDARGNPLLGWQTIEGEKYYFNPSENGAMSTGWLSTEDGLYFLGNSGTRVIGWADMDGVRYYFNESGIMLTGWVETESGQYYLDEKGVLQTGWVEIDGSHYYMDDSGRVSAGWLDIDDERYYFADSGVMQTGWVEVDGDRYYLEENGQLCTGWRELDGDRYYFSESGSMETGWKNIGDKRYYLTDSGAAQTGWMETEDARYYFHEDGRMAIGEVEIDGVIRYFTSTGKYFVLVNPWNPVPEDYEMNLVEIGGFKVDVVCRDALEEMITACEAAGYSCNISSAYRSYDRQVFLFEQKVTKLMGQGYSRKAAEKETALSVAVPGTSEHQLGLAVDLKNGNGTYDWLAKHSWEYGFTLRYPYGKTDLTGIYYEPWHFRYVGDELAKELYDLGLCVEEYMNMLTELAGSET